MTNRRRRIAIALATAGIAVTGLLSAPAFAGTTVTPNEGGSPPLVRQDHVTVKVSLGAQFYYRSGATATVANNANFIDETQTGYFLLGSKVCRGNNPAPGGKNNSPRDTVTVAGPGGTVATQVSPARNTLGSGAPVYAWNAQPAPGDSVYLGDFPGTAATRGFSFDVDLTGKPAGIYTVTTVSEPRIKTDVGTVQGPCQTGYPDPANPKIAKLGTQTSSMTFEYRPWQAKFVDVFNGGKVDANVIPNEFQFGVGPKTSTIYGAGYQTFYSLPGTAPYTLPTDPAECASDPASCLPNTAVLCVPGSGCVPRLMIINKVSGTQKLQGIFDLDTKAFIALANIDGVQRALLSLGTANDATYHDLLVKLQAAAAAQHTDLASLLATTVRVRNGQNELTLSLLNGLQIAPSNKTGGIQIVTDTTVQAGVILDIYSNVAGSCPLGNRTVNSTTAPLKYTPVAGSGYTVTRTALPSVPAVGPLAAIASGPIYHITGKFTGGTSSASAVIGVDTAADEPNGYPVWVEPFLASGHAASPKTLDFLGTATWSASEIGLGPLGCLTIDVMLGTGVAIYNNPLPVGFGTLLDPALDATPTTDALNAQINSAVQTVVTTASANPVVNTVLTTLVGLL